MYFYFDNCDTIVIMVDLFFLPPNKFECQLVWCGYRKSHVVSAAVMVSGLFVVRMPGFSYNCLLQP